MFEAYAVSVTLRINNLVSPQLVLLAREFSALESTTLGLIAKLKTLGAESTGLRGVATAMRSVETATERATRSAAQLQTHLAGIRAAAASMPAMGPVLGTGGGGGARSTPGVGVGTGGGAAHRPGGFHGGNIHMGSGGIGIGAVGLGAGNAILPLAIAAGSVYGGHSLYESAKALDTERARFRLLGMNEQQNAEATRFITGMRVYGTTQLENSKNFREAQGIFRESGLDGSHALEGAKLAAPILAKLNFATASLDEEAKNRMHSSNLAMLRWVEMSGGLKSPQKFGELADLGWKLTQTSGGNVNWEALRQFSAISGNAGRFISAAGLAALEPVIGELKGSGAGTGLRTALNRVTGIVRIPNQVAHSLVENGIWDSSRVEWNKSGGVKKFNGNPFMTYDDFVKSPVEWYAKNIIPLYDKQRLSPEERGRSNSMLFGGTGGRLFTLIEQQLPTLMLSVAAANKALGINASVSEGKKTLGGQEREFAAAWGDFKTEFSTAALPAFSKLLTNGAGFLRGINTFMGSPAIKSFIELYEKGFKFQEDLFKNFFKAAPAGLPAPSGGFVQGTNEGGAFTGYRSPIRSAPGAGGQAINNTIVMPDGRVLASVVTKVQSQELQRPQTGPRTADGRQSLRAFDLSRGG